MKALIFTMTMLLSINSFAKDATYTSRKLQYALEILTSITEESKVTKVQPNKDIKAMMIEYGIKEGALESAEDFNWVDDNSAWEGDSTKWGRDTLEGAKSYVIAVLEQRLEYSDNNSADKVTFADNYMKAQHAFSLLNEIKGIQYGVGPVGAVQCGGQYAALLIIDPITGTIYTIIMEASGC
ncbi:hypothetical protein [Bdellovibrio bacteriovorus]|uniref:SCP domain-containing protein n=1 Tax=Bdellovibrio bacteriovorus str. Tiberius TaxID=1069642 RepID=K7ZEW8_BDEBC|nr:hypothetical protein [Bdellovibrio bacteriovorus]AFY00902.1 hypothetical protein Bdt_1203 [Bdellovibrio bacteriovorus str. Tiberius]